jgi:hypothetical protein
MERDESLAIKIRTENGETYTGIRPGELRELVHRIGSDGDNFLVVQRIPDLPDVFIQVWHETLSDYQLEHRESHERFFRTQVEDADRVAAAMTGWARGQDGWDSEFPWEPLPHDAPEEVPELAQEIRAQVEERVRELLCCGYDTRDELVEAAEEYLVDGDHRPVSRAQAWELVDRLWLERVAEQETWEGATEPERLTEAFEFLDARGVTAREDFTCCRTCGLTEIGAEREDARGFVFFHHQGTESAARGHGLMLYYGGFDDSAETTAAVGREVVAALAAVGLPTEWDGSPGTGILLTPLDWRKRLVG